MSKQHSLLALLLAGSLSAVVSAAPVREDPDTLQVRSATIRFDAARIGDERAARKLYMQIRQAAEEVCRIASHPRGYEIWEEHDCEAEAVSEAVHAADLPALDAFYAGGPGAAEALRR